MELGLSALTLISDLLGIIILDVVTLGLTAHEKGKNVQSILCCYMASMFSIQFNLLCALEFCLFVCFFCVWF